MALGQYIAGMGFSNVGLGIVHSMAHGLSALYDKAFDKGLFTVDEHFKIKLSSSLKDHLTKDSYDQHFAWLDNLEITLPSRGKPAVEFLYYHNKYVFVA